MANKTSCVIITPDLKKRYCETDSISENDLALLFYKFLENPRTPNELTDEVLDSKEFKDYYNWYFKLGNSRFLITTPSVFRAARKNWENLKTWGMDNEGYLVIDTAEKQNILNWLKNNDDFKYHFVSYQDLNGNVTVKIEQPIYSGKRFSDAQLKTIYGIKAQSIEEIQNLLKERHIIHKYMGKWYLSKTSDAKSKYEELVKEGLVDDSKITMHPRLNSTIVEFDIPGGIREYDDIQDSNVYPKVDTSKIKANSELIRHIIIKSLYSNEREFRSRLEEKVQKLNSFKRGDSIDAVSLLQLFNTDEVPKEYKALANAILPLFIKQNITITFSGNEDRATAGTVFVTGTKIDKVLINVETPKVKKVPHQVILHELIHALSISALVSNASLNQEVEAIMEVVKNFLKEHQVQDTAKYIINGIEQELPFDIYGLKNSREFIAEAFSNQNFQLLLSSIPVEKAPQTAWTRFINAIINGLKDLFNISYNKTTNIYEALVPIIADVITKSAYISDLTTNDKIDAETWEKSLDSEQLTLASKIASEMLSVINPLKLSENYYNVVANFGGYFEGGGANIKQDFPNLSKDLIDKLEEHLWTGSEFTEEDAIQFLKETNLESTTSQVEIDPWEKADKLYLRIRDYFANRVAYSQNFKQDHTYLRKDENGNWIPVDKSVSQVVEKSLDPNSPWKEVSIGLGNTNDEFMRDFFAGQLKSSYPNLTADQYETLKKSAFEVVKYLNDLLGEGNYKVSSQEFPILGYIKENGQIKSVAGTMDLLVYTKEGDFYIIDMKTKRVEGLDSPDMSRSIEGYSKQQFMYKNILETAIPELRGKIKQPLLLVSTVSYPSPKKGYTYTRNSKGEIIVSYINSNGVTIKKPITQLQGYVAPKYHSFMSTQDVDKEIKEIMNLTSPEEFEAEYGTPEVIKKSLEERRKITLSEKQSKEAAETEELYTIIPKEEVMFLGKDIAATFSSIVDELLSDKEANDDYFINVETGINPYAHLDFTKMSREDLLNTPFLVENLLNQIKERFYNPDSDFVDIEDESLRCKYVAAYINFDALVKANYTEFIKLEGLTFNKSTTKTYIQDGIDPSIINTEDPSENEDNGREHWQIGIRNMSAMSGLSSRLRRFLSTIEDVDKDGNPKVDRFGYNKAITLNGNEVVNSLLSWLKDCNTMEEMETVLKRLSKTHPWIDNLLDEIQNEPIRSQFFQCFRKDFTEYSTIITVKKFDEYGNPHWETVNRIINTVGAVDKIIGEIKDAYFNRDFPIFKDGLFNISTITAIKDKFIEVEKYLVNPSNWKNLKENLTEDPMFKLSKKLLNSLGIMLDDIVLADLIASDEDVKSFAGSKLSKIIVQAKYITDNLLEGSSKETYDPLSRGSNNSVYNSYKNIATIAEQYVTTALEASTYANGKLYYSFVSPSYMGQLLNNLVNTDKTSLAEYLENNYGQYQWFKTNNEWNIQWLKDIENNRDVIARKVQLSYEGTDYVDLGEKAYMMSLLKEFFYDQKNKSLAWYRVPTLSNKPSSEFIRNKRYSGDFKRELKKQLFNIVLQEIKRAQTVVERAVSGSITEADKLKNYDIKFNSDSKSKVLDKLKNGELITIDDVVIDGKYIFEDSGASFKFLDGFVNEIVNKTDLGIYLVNKIFNRNTKDADFIGAIETTIETLMNAKVEATKNYFREIELTGTEMNFMLSGDTINKKTSPEEALEKLTPAIEEYVWNDFVATANIIQLTTTDLAYYKDSVDFQKRYAQVHSPGLRLNKTATNIINGIKQQVSDGKLRSLLIADKISVSEIKENVRIALDNHINNMEEGPAKEEFKIMADLIVSSFEEINEADAQAFTSPTGYMKKMVMAGEWNNAMQEAYERIRKGNYNIDDLGVVWQPIKPFIYTQNGVKGHSTTSPMIKVPSQHKNSEYMLLIADALTRGDGQNSTLNAIMEFMEETHYKDDKYQQNGIDTIEFDSAVKVGVHGVININNLTYNEVKKKLHESNDESHIFEYPVEDYAIQQNVPAHFKEHTQPMGSQIRALVLSDLIGNSYKPLGKNVTYTASQINIVYQDLIARNVYRSWDKLANDLGLKGDRFERNQKLSDLLLEEMSKDARYGADLRRAVMLDENGEFIIPLDDPIHSSRIQQLINSMVKGRINKQRTKGGPVVQASSFGLSKDLNIIFQDKDGNELDTITEYGKKTGYKGKTLENLYKKYLKDKQASVKHFECYIPLPSGIFEELMLVDDGKRGKRTLSIEEATNPKSEHYVVGLKDCLNAIGYRIPTEDTYSMVPIKIAGFVPKAAGEVVMLPKEITLLSGSDFDIDKLYIMMPELQRVHYNRAAAYEYWSERVAPTSKAVAKLTSSIFEEDVTSQKFEEWLRTEDAERFKIRGIRKVKYEPLDPNSSDYSKKLQEMSKEQVNNAIFDIQWGIITNEASMVKMLNPGSFDVQKKASRIISIARDKSNNLSYEDLMKMSLKELDKLIPKENKNILDATTQVYFFKQNMTAGKLIGVFANANVSHVFCNGVDIIINEDFTFDGVNFKDKPWDPTYSITGRFVSKNIAGYVGASVDAVKDPVFANMNINMNTVNPALILTRLGVNPEEVALLTSQPIIVIFSQMMDAAKEKNSYVDPIEIINELLLEYAEENEELLATINGSLAENKFEAKSLFDNIKNEDKDISLRVGVLFKRLLAMSDDMKGITYCTKFNSITNAPGPLFTDNIYAKQRVDRFLKKVEDGLTMFSSEAANIIGVNPIIHSLYKATMDKGNIVEVIASTYWKYYNTTFKEISDTFSSMVGRPIKGEKLEKIYQDYIYYCLGNNLIEIPIINSNDVKDVLTKFPDLYISTLKDIEKNNLELFERELKYNPLIQRVKRMTPSSKFPIPTLQMESGKMVGEIQEEIKNGWAALVNSDNNTIRELGITLFFYNLYRSGFRFSPKTFLHLAPTDVKYAVYNYIDSISDNSLFDLSREETTNFIIQYNRNHPNEFLHDMDIDYFEYENENGEIVSEIKDGKIGPIDPNGYLEIIDGVSEFGIYVKPIIKVDGILYVSTKDKYRHDEKVEYIEVSPLGYENNAVEYDFNGTRHMESALRKYINTSNNSRTVDGIFGTMSEDFDTKTSYTKTTGETDTDVSSKEKTVIPSQLNEQQLSKLLKSFSHENDIMIASQFGEGGLFTTSTKFEDYLEILKREGAFSQYQDVEEIKDATKDYTNIYNKIMELVKDICS